MTQKHLQAKRNHHHVWADYLKRWSSNEKDVYYSTVKGKIALDSVKAIAVERDFYQIQLLEETHVEIIKNISLKSPKELQKLHASCLHDFLIIQNAEKEYKRTGKKNIDMENIIHATKCNLLENLHSRHEKDVQETISYLAEKNFEFLQNEETLISFINFFGHQISRTKTFKDTALSTLSKTGDNTEKSIAKNIHECWWFISYILGMNIGASLYTTRKIDKHCILLNDTEIPFITSDQPIINVHTSLLDDKISPPDDEHCDFYYPITPSVAYMINKSDRFQKGINQVSTDVVNELNIKLAHRANVYIVSNSEDSLKPLLKYVGQHFKKVHGS